MNKLHMLFLTSRPVSWVNTAYPFAAAYLMMDGGIDAQLVIGTTFFLIPYNLMMYGINDVFDYESDIRNPRKGGFEGAVTPKQHHNLIIRSSLLLALPFVVALLAMGSFHSALVLALVLFFVVAYSAKGLRYKEIPFLDSITSSIHFVGPMLYALSLTGGTPIAWQAALAFFFWGIASQAFGAVQDIIPDRASGIRSIATVMGAAWTVRFAVVMYAAAAFLIAAMGGLGWIVAFAGVLYCLSIAQYIFLTDKNSGSARAGWKRFMWINYITGAVVTLCCIVSIM